MAVTRDDIIAKWVAVADGRPSFLMGDYVVLVVIPVDEEELPPATVSIQDRGTGSYVFLQDRGAAEPSIYEPGLWEALILE